MEENTQKSKNKGRMTSGRVLLHQNLSPVDDDRRGFVRISGPMKLLGEEQPHASI